MVLVYCLWKHTVVNLVSSIILIQQTMYACTWPVAVARLQFTECLVRQRSKCLNVHANNLSTKSHDRLRQFCPDQRRFKPSLFRHKQLNTNCSCVPHSGKEGLSEGNFEGSFFLRTHNVFSVPKVKERSFVQMGWGGVAQHSLLKPQVLGFEGSISGGPQQLEDWNHIPKFSLAKLPVEPGTFMQRAKPVPVVSYDHDLSLALTYPETPFPCFWSL